MKSEMFDLKNISGEMVEVSFPARFYEKVSEYLMKLREIEEGEEISEYKITYINVTSFPGLVQHICRYLRNNGYVFDLKKIVSVKEDGYIILSLKKKDVEYFITTAHSVEKYKGE